MLLFLLGFTALINALLKVGTHYMHAVSKTTMCTRINVKLVEKHSIAVE